MRFAWMSACKDLRRLGRDLPALACWLILPLVISGLIGLVFGRQDLHPHGLLLMADEDGGLAGTFVRELISRGPLGHMMAVEQSDRASGHDRLKRGEASALLIIPKGFDNAVTAGQAAELAVVTNPEQRIMPQLACEMASATVDAAIWVQRMGPQGAAGAATYLRPPRINLKTTVITPPGTPRTVIELLFPGAVFLVLLLLAQGLGVEVWKEHQAGALRRLRTTPSSMHAFLAGKLGACLVVFAVAIAVVLLAGAFLYGVRMAAPALAFAWALGCAAALYLGVVVIELLLANPRTALLVANLFITPLAMLGGSFFPIEIMPESFARVARAIPNGWMLVQFKAIVNGQPLAPASVAILVASAAATYALAGWLMARRMAE